MGALRHFLLARRGVVFLVIAFALAMKALIPAGFMVQMQGHVLTVAVCADASGGHVSARQILIPAKPGDNPAAPTKTGEGCAFSALAIAGLSGAAPELLALALAFILLLGVRAASAPRLALARRIRPPLRAPPILV